MIYKYYSNGLFINSEVSLPELPASTHDTADVSIILGEVPDHLDDAISTSEIYEVGQDDFLLKIDNVATYHVKNSTEVIVSPISDDKESIKAFLLSTILGVVLHKKDILPLHASCINFNGQAILFGGHSGAGKSTIALGFNHLGYDVLNDDISSITFDDSGRASVQPGVVRLKLSAESLEHYGYYAEDFSILRLNVEKYNYPIARSKVSEPIPIKAIFFITLKNTGEISHEIINDRMRIFDVLRIHTFRRRLVNALGKYKNIFNSYATLTNQGHVQYISIVRPKDTNPVDIVNYIKNIMHDL